MFDAAPIDTDATPKPELYRLLARQLATLIAGERDPVANAANMSALIWMSLPGLNWAGFYFLKSPDELVLGPFQGRPACVRIARGRGVCGTAVAEGRTLQHDMQGCQRRSILGFLHNPISRIKEKQTKKTISSIFLHFFLLKQISSEYTLARLQVSGRGTLPPFTYLEKKRHIE